MNLLPSKKVLSIFILSGALVASIIIAFGREKSATAINFASNLVAGEKVSIPSNPDWQSDLSNVGVKASATSVSETNSPETATDSVSRSLVSNYLALKQNGILDQTSAQKLVDQTLSFIEQSGGKVTLVSQLNVIPDNGKQSMTDYGENLGNILRNNKPKVVKNELEIISKIAQSKDQSQVNNLDEIIAFYQNLSTDLVKMPVPKLFVKAHLDMVNGARGMATALTEAKSVLGDPIKGLSSLNLYQQGATIFTQALRATNSFINQNGIVYKQGSGGYYLLYGI